MCVAAAAGAVTGAKVQDRSLTASDFRQGALPAGPEGPEGPQGPAGDPASFDLSDEAAWTITFQDGPVTVPAHDCVSKSHGTAGGAVQAGDVAFVSTTPAPAEGVTVSASLSSLGASPAARLVYCNATATERTVPSPFFTTIYGIRP